MNNKLDLIKIINTILNFLDKDLDFEKSQDLTFRDLKLSQTQIRIINEELLDNGIESLIVLISNVINEKMTKKKRLTKKKEAFFDELGLSKNTIIIFTADNGGMSASNQYYGVNHNEEQLNSRFASSNLPLRGAKGWNYEGGIRVPLIVYWPGQTKPQTMSHSIVTGTDFYPTIMEMLNIPKLPEQHVDGKSFVNALKGKTHDRGAIYWHFPHYSNHGYQSPGGAIRLGNYKLLEYYENSTVQLFDLHNDPGEQNDLSKPKPEITKELLSMLHDWRKNVGAKMPKVKAARNSSRN